MNRSKIEPRAMAGGAGAGAGAAGAGKSIAMILAGCGCVTVVILGVIAAVAIGGGFWAYNSVKESAPELIEQGKEAIESAKELEKQARELEEQASKQVKKPSKEVITAESMLRWTTSPISKEDIEQNAAFMDEWRTSDVYKKLSDSRTELEETAREATADDSTLEKLSALNKARGYMVSGAEAQKEIERLAKKYGGEDEVFRRYLQVSALSAAAKDLAAQEKIAKPYSKRTARKMVSEHGTYKKKYEAWRAGIVDHFDRIGKLSANPEELQKALDDPETKKVLDDYNKALQLQNEMPGLFVLGRMHPDSLTLWKSLPEGQRRAAIEEYSRLPLVSYVMFVPKDTIDHKAMARFLLAAEVGLLMQELQGKLGDKLPE